MRIAYLTSSYARAGDTFIRLEVRLLRRRGHEVLTYSVREPADTELVGEEIRRERAGTDYILRAGFWKLLSATGREFARAPARFVGTLGLALRTRPPGLRGLVKGLAYFVEGAYLAGRVREGRIEHLHNHIAENSASVAMLAAVLSGVPYSLAIHGPSEFDRPYELALGEKIRRARFVTVISQYTKSQVMRFCSEDDWPKLHVVRCGLDAEFLDARPPGLPQENRFVCVGRLTPVKGQHLLIEACAKLRESGIDFELEVVGDGELRGRVERAIAKGGLETCVRLSGWKDSQGVRESIEQARVFVLPSFSEGLPVVIMEALALGRPVISTYIAGIPELVRSGENGWLIPAGSVEELTEAMRDASRRTTAQLEEFARAGVARVRAQHDGEAEVARLEALLTGNPLPATASETSGR
jgi:glycosyltransferase involved in cell wall biosynthesis